VSNEHTPGPWESPGTDGGARVVCATIRGKRRTVAHVYGDADARLIAAAPAMLEALRMVVAHGGALTGEDWTTICAAIATAEGGAA